MFGFSANMFALQTYQYVTDDLRKQFKRGVIDRKKLEERLSSISGAYEKCSEELIKLESGANLLTALMLSGANPLKEELNKISLDMGLNNAIQ